MMKQARGTGGQTGVKHQGRNPKFQTPSSKEAPSCKSQFIPRGPWTGCLALGAWSFFGAWDLELGASLRLRTFSHLSP